MSPLVRDDHLDLSLGRPPLELRASASSGQISICPLAVTSISEAGITHTADFGPTCVHREPVSRMLGGSGTSPVDQARVRSTPLRA